ncbi:MAG TPA: hypothetical protein VIG99_30770 [Myxococcaceae bacterium]
MPAVTEAPKKAYQPPAVRSEAVSGPPTLFAGSGQVKEPEEPSADPQPRP